MTGSSPRKTIDALLSGRAAIGVWGCGHIGASAMYHFSRKGVRCVGYDIDRNRVKEIRDGHFLSTDIAPSGRTVSPNRLVTATTEWKDLRTAGIAVHIISVPTERGAEPSSAALEVIMPLICDIIQAGELDDVVPAVIIESTIQPNWIDTVILPSLHCSGLRPGVDVLVGAAPRRDWFSGGQHTLETLPRIVGGNDATALELLVELYSLVCNEVITARDAHHAAFTKVIENLLRFQGLVLANSLSLAFPQYDMTHVLSLASTKWNIPLYHPSMGVGGHCIPLAPRYAVAEGHPGNEYLKAVTDAIEMNDGYFSRLYQAQLRELLGTCRSIAVLGLAYTADAKMHKLSPALDAIECLKDTPLLRLHDPYYSAEDIDNICGVASISFPDDLRGCDGIILVTPHSEYVEADVSEIIQPGTVIVDNFGTWRHKKFPAGVRYFEVGRRVDEDSRDLTPAPEPSSVSAT